MQWLRSIPRFIRVLVALFLVAQFAGVVSSPLANAQGIAAAFHAQDHHAQDHHAHNQGGQGTFHHHGDQTGDRADHCCALHAFFAGILPPVIAIETAATVGQRLAANLADVGQGVAPGGLDRPPRPLL
jgi:hypothetical protein